MNKKTVRDIDVAGKRVFLRVDYNVQFDEGEILDDYRLRESIPTLEYLIEQGVPSNRLVAAGFGENQPLDPEDTPEARARNRRIELKLTER